jgi:hypothetical protein
VWAGRWSETLLIIPWAEVERCLLGREESRPSPVTEDRGNGAAACARVDIERCEISSRMMTAARERVVAGWCQGAVAQDKDGHAVGPGSSEARRWSMLGALLASWDGWPVEELGQAVTSLLTSTEQSPLEVWNDHPGRTQTDVVAAFERAIESLARREYEVTSAREDLSAYWLRTCEGFRVDSKNGRLGIVEEVRLSPAKQPEALVVRTGLFRLRLEIVPVGHVQRVIPRRKRVLPCPATG